MNLTLATRIFVGYAVVTLAFGAVSVFSVLQMRAIGQDIRVVSEGYLPLTKVVAQLESTQKNRQRETHRLLEERQPDIQRALIRLARLSYPQLTRERLGAATGLARATRALTSAQDAPQLDSLIAQLDNLVKLSEDYIAESEALFSAIETTGQVDRSSAEVRKVAGLEAELDRSLHALGLVLDARVADRVGSVQLRERRGAWTIIALSVFAIALGLAATAYAGRLLRPVKPLTEAVTRIGEGDFAAEIPTAARGEIGVLAHEFGAMAAKIRDRERELAEKQTALLRAERLAAIGRVSAQITHEIRNPLTSLGLNTELLEESLLAAEFPSPGTKEEASQLLTAIAHEVDRLAEITEQYLKFARFPKPVIAPEEINGLVGSLLDFLGEEHARAGVTIERTLAPRLPRALCDRGQIRQALMNLLRNSREALVHGGAIKLETRALVTQVEIAVTDDGPGIKPAELERLFDPFFSNKERGTGLGLALTQQIIVEQGGEIRASSELGRGTRFVIRLPRAS